MATFTIAPDFNSSVAIKPRVLAAQFGDGYAMRAGDGINTRADEWQLTFSSRTAAERDTIMAFLGARNGTEPFDWTAPDGTAGRWTCPEWGYAPNTAAANTITARFVRDFAP